MFRWIISLALLGSLFTCRGKKEEIQDDIPVRVLKVAPFNSDSAYWFVERQVKFGPRVPNTPSHREAGDFLILRFKEYGARVVIQDFDAVSFDGKKLFLRNIIASYFPEKQKRILLAAHWDTRPFSDKDKQNPDARFDGANDGASGVGVLLEVARALGKNPAPEVGVDIILFDGEDWGEKVSASNRIPSPPGESWWCLGSQYWSKNKHKNNYSAYYGILLDMVGASDSHFFQEGYSMEYAPRIVEKVWATGSRLGYSSIFVRQKEASIIDDHLYVNELARIPMIDIVHYDPAVGYFGDYHHTQQDNLAIISKEILGAVGNVLLNVIYYEE